MDRICPFSKMNCTERCQLNLLGSCAFESLRDIGDSLMFKGETATCVTEDEAPKKATE